MRLLPFLPSLAAIAVLGLAALVPAQGHTTDLISVDSGGRLWRTTTTGAATSLAERPSPAHGVYMHYDNRRILFTQATLAPSIPGAILVYDPATQAVATLWSSPLVSPFDVIQNGDGDLVFTGETASGPGLYKIVSGAMTTIVTTVELGVPVSRLNAGLSLNVRTGNYIIATGIYTNPNYRFVWDVSDRGVITTLGPAGDARYSHVQDPSTGVVYISGYKNIYELGVGALAVSTLISGPSNYYAITLDRASAPNPMLMARTASFVYTVNPKTGMTTSVAVANSSSTTYETIYERNRNIATVKVGPRRWQVRLSFPGEGGRYYYVALSKTGIRPGFKIHDGRRILLLLDDLVKVTLNRLLPKWMWDAGPGQLDANGEAVATIDCSKIPNVGVPIFICAATVGTANLGTISAPISFIIP